jgi:hypothetical protein
MSEELEFLKDFPKLMFVETVSLLSTSSEAGFGPLVSLPSSPKA